MIEIAFETEIQSFFNIFDFWKIHELQIRELQNRELQGPPYYRVGSGTANRGYCEAVIEVMTNFFGLYSNFMPFN